MSIKEFLEKIKPFYALIMIIVVGSIFFAIGRLSTISDSHTPIKIEYGSSTSTASVIGSTNPEQNSKVVETKTSVTPPTSSGEVVGSKNSNKYYFPWCGTAKRIKPENLVHFSSSEEARAKGYIPGGNCKGLK